MDRRSLEGRWALITGGGRGIGRAIALELAERGADLILNYKSGKDAAEATAEELRAMGREAWTVQGDVRKPADLDKLAAEVIERCPHLDILVLNAAFGTIDDVYNVGRASWKATFDTNVVASWYLGKSLLPMLKQSRGCVLSLSSIGAVMPFPQYVAIGVSKSATEALVRQMAVEWGRYGIRVNGISAGPVDTRAIDWFRYPNAVRQFARDKSVFKRMAEVDDLAPVAAFLCTDEARWITGQTIIADGGITIGIDSTDFDAQAAGSTEAELEDRS